MEGSLRLDPGRHGNLIGLDQAPQGIAQLGAGRLEPAGQDVPLVVSDAGVLGVVVARPEAGDIDRLDRPGEGVLVRRLGQFEVCCLRDILSGDRSASRQSIILSFLLNCVPTL